MGNVGGLGAAVGDRAMQRLRALGIAAVLAATAVGASAGEPRLIAQGAGASPSAAEAAPVYMPPRMGGPREVTAAATRSEPARTDLVRLLAPNHTGLTLAEQPTLYMYVGEAGALNVTVRSQADLAGRALASGRIEVASAPAIIPLSLGKLGASLRVGSGYIVNVAMYDSTGRVKSSDSAALERVNPPAEIARAASGKPLERARLFAAAGLWFDAVGALGEAIAANPALRPHRAALLDQIGLSAVAAFDRAAPRG